ncbi:hypothetical protein [Pengzhenrongella phosphoraccumulans]|uniref:hypothetical protein n=1 Tax=Pengzhenrongella phosphoraccumulans TaxID=3114394 RepID=UPI00388FCC2A
MLEHLLSLPRWLIVSIIVVVALLGATDQMDRGSAARAEEAPCTFKSVDYTYGYAAALDARAVTGAELNGVAPVCAGRVVRITFHAKDGRQLAGATTRVVAPRTVLLLRSEEALRSSSIKGFDVVVEGSALEG